MHKAQQTFANRVTNPNFKNISIFAENTRMLSLRQKLKHLGYIFINKDGRMLTLQKFGK